MHEFYPYPTIETGFCLDLSSTFAYSGPGRASRIGERGGGDGNPEGLESREAPRCTFPPGFSFRPAFKPLQTRSNRRGIFLILTNRESCVIKENKGGRFGNALLLGL